MDPEGLRPRRREAAAYSIAIGLFVLGLWLELLIAHVAGPEFRLVAFSLAIAASAWQGGLGPGVLTLVLAIIASDYFLLGPGAWLRVDSPSEAYTPAGFTVGLL